MGGKGSGNPATLIARHPGERNGRSKLIAEDVALIRRLRREEGYSHRQLAEMFDLHHTTISDIVTYKTWKHVGD